MSVRLAERGFVEFDGGRLEYRFTGPAPEAAPMLVLLHEGLGCAGLWLDFPERLAMATGMSVFAWSRAGYGQSSPAPLPWPLDYMQREAREVLPKLLDAIGFRRGLLIGHSDGASIAAVHAGRFRDPRVAGISLIAPHFFVEAFSLVEIAKAKTAYETGDLKAKLGRWHADPDNAFRGWNDSWLHPDFKRWDIRSDLQQIAVPVQIVQGEADLYGTMAHADAARALCPTSVEVFKLQGIGHSPHREAVEATTAGVADFCRRALNPA
jgi:pimeloyl-ACP methyl ester carboxylesterase